MIIYTNLFKLIIYKGENILKCLHETGMKLKPCSCKHFSLHSEFLFPATMFFLLLATSLQWATDRFVHHPYHIHCIGMGDLIVGTRWGKEGRSIFRKHRKLISFWSGFQSLFYLDLLDFGEPKLEGCFMGET